MTSGVGFLMALLLMGSWASDGAAGPGVLEMAQDPGGQKARFRRPGGGGKAQEPRPSVVGGQGPRQIPSRLPQKAAQDPDPDPEVGLRIEGILPGAKW
jgi:hypothetical protein